MLKVNEIIDTFFNFEKPCPSEIPYCEKVRQSYKSELDKISSSTGCSSCAKSKLKARFVEAIWKEAMQSLNKDK